jgi:hypothetical protein
VSETATETVVEPVATGTTAAPATSDASGSALAASESRARDYQSQRDRAVAAVERLENRLSELEAQLQQNFQPASIGRAEIHEESMNAFAKASQLLAQQERLRTEYPDVVAWDPALFDGATPLRYENPEAYRSAVETLNSRIQAVKGSPVEDTGGGTPTPGPGPVDSGQGTQGTPTFEDYARANFQERSAIEAKYGREFVEELIREQL